MLPDACDLVDLWTAFRDHGCLPEPGGMLDQAAKVMDAFAVCAGAAAALEAWYREMTKPPKDGS